MTVGWQVADLRRIFQLERLIMWCQHDRPRRKCEGRRKSTSSDPSRPNRRIHALKAHALLSGSANGRGFGSVFHHHFYSSAVSKERSIVWSKVQILHDPPLFDFFGGIQRMLNRLVELMPRRYSKNAQSLVDVWSASRTAV